MSRVAAWNGEEWVQRVASEAEKRARWRSGGRRWVNAEEVYGGEQVDEGWQALWELTEARCECGAIEVVAWRPGHRNGKHAGPVLRTQCVECWQCGEVLDLRLERRDRQAEEDTEDARIERELRVLHGDLALERRRVRAGSWVPRERAASRYVVDRSGKRRPGAPVAKVAPVEVVAPVVDKAARRAEAIRTARAHKGGIRFIVGGVSKSWRAARG